jgi:hypothetical protein
VKLIITSEHSSTVKLSTLISIDADLLIFGLSCFNNYISITNAVLLLRLVPAKRKKHLDSILSFISDKYSLEYLFRRLLFIIGISPIC